MCEFVAESSFLLVLEKCYVNASDSIVLDKKYAVIGIGVSQ